MNNKLNEVVALMREKGIPEDLIEKFENNCRVIPPRQSTLEGIKDGIINKGETAISLLTKSIESVGYLKEKNPPSD